MVPLRLFLLILIGTIVGSTIADAQRAVSGTVTDARTGEAMITTQVLLFRDTIPFPRTPIRTALTNKFGFFTLPDVPSGRSIIITRALGYTSAVDSIVVGENDLPHQIIEMKEEPIELQEVVVEDQRDQAVAPVLSRIDVSLDLLQSLPAFAGEKDVFRVLQLLPGVKSASEISSGLYIRGGSPDQNLILLDGVIVYNPFHLGGFFSTFNPDALLSVGLQKGAFPAEYGGRLSSVIEMTMKEGTKEGFRGSGGVSLITSRLTLQGPIIDGMTFMVSGRRMYLDILVWLAGKSADAPTYYFYDLNAKLNYRLSEKDRFFASGYFGADVVTPPEGVRETVDIGWHNETEDLRWTHIFSPELFSNFTLVQTRFNFSTTIGASNSAAEFATMSEIRDRAVKADLQYHPHPDHLMKGGVEMTQHRFQAEASTNIGVTIPGNFNIIRSDQLDLYAQDEWSVTQRLQMNAGMRSVYFGSGKYLKVEPRLSASYAVDDLSAVKASYSEAHQFLHLINRNDILLPTDVWFPSTATVAPSSSAQYVLGVESSFHESEYRWSIEAYYKRMSDLYEYRDNADFALGVPLETQFTAGTGTAYGMEFFLQKKMGNVTGWLGYTLAWTRRQFAEVNLGRPFYPRYDRRHDISLVLNYRLAENWEIGGNWTYGTGQAYTITTGSYLFQRIDLRDDRYTSLPWEAFRNVTDRNNYRAPAFHKLDLGITWHRRVFGLASEVSLNIYNAYNRQNPFFIYVGSQKIAGTNNDKPVLKQQSLFPLIPTIGWSFTF